MVLDVDVSLKTSANLTSIDKNLFPNGEIRNQSPKKTKATDEFLNHNAEIQNNIYKEYGRQLEARTPGTIIDEVRVAADKLRRLDIFQYVDMFLDSSNDPRALDVILSVEEKSRFWIKTGTEIGNDAGSANISLNVRNAFGGAESLEAYMSAGTQTSHVFEFCLAKPINGNPDSRVDISAFSLTKNNQIYSSRDEIMRGIALTWRFDYLSLTPRNYSIRESAGHSLKSSVTHTLIRDKRDDLMLPSKGYYIKLFQEFAGLGGDVNFIKNEIESQANFPLGKGFLHGAFGDNKDTDSV
ncbi:hypothetical protein C2G38_2046223 [Gigaspora rosea]|uniref:Bacterial surface antigen (D15) domain-containing protein n=1 Tax=Gigaspora rosea TaxID=44941 RepID=A0A397UEE9_9GLOM|nr:hypothetical protein C2G38_2046223 [Gigaspora rosea]